MDREGGLSHARYDAVCDAAGSYRDALVVRLLGEVGLRPAELTRIRPRDVVERRSDPPRYLLSVPTESGEEDRRAYLPTAVERELRRYVEGNEVGDDEPIFPVSARRLQMIVGEVADRAAERRDDPALEDVSTADLRRFFARRALVDHEVNPRAVKAAGGWGSFQGLEPYLPEPTDETVVEAFDAVEVDRSNPTENDRTRLGHSHRALTEALLDASTPAEIETALCESLTGDGRGPAGPYALAWIERRTPAESERPRAVRGIDADDATALSSAVDADGAVAVRADRGPESAFSGRIATVEVGYGDTAYATLYLGSDREDAFAEDERRWLETIGRQAGHAIAAARRRTLLLSSTLVELDLRCRDERSFLVSASSRLGCRFELDSLVSPTETTGLHYVRLEGASPAEVFDLADQEPAIDDCRLVETREDEWLLEVVVGAPSPLLTLTEYGTTVLAATVEDGVARITAECSADADVRAIVEGFRSAFPDSDLAGKREVERSVRTAGEFREGLGERLTDRQEAALEAAYFGGYYDWPRESTAEEIADAMGVSSPTLHNHLRKGQHELLEAFFDDPSDDGHPAETR